MRFILDNTGKIFGITSDLFSRPVDEENLAGWMQFRKTVTSYTKRSNLAQFTPVITKVVDEALNTIKPGQHFKVLDLMEFMTSLSINLFVFGEAGRVVPEPASKLLDALLVMIGNPFAFPMWLPTLTNLRIRAAKKLMETAIDKAMLVSDNETTLLYTLRHSEFADGVPSDDQIRNALMGMLLAAHRVPAAALAWIWYLLDRNPDVLAILQCEVDKVCLEELPSLLGRLRFTRAVIKEAMRLYPPTWLMEREALVPTMIRGYSVSKGFKLLFSPYILHRDQRYFEKPDEFLPERWLTEGLDEAKPERAYFPFGGGHRLCLGTNYAVISMMIIVTKLAKHFSIRCSEPKAIDCRATLLPKDLIGQLVQRTAAKKSVPTSRRTVNSPSDL